MIKYFFITAILFSSNLYAKKDLSAFGRIGIIGHYEDSDISLEDSGSRIGFKAQKKLGTIKAYAKGEWAFSAVNNTSDLSIGDNNNYVSSEGDQSFKRRLGFLGFDFAEYGDLRIGKQWSVYSDVSHFTDVFNLFGGSASGTYNLRTDGGQSGTGRVSNGITYRNTIWGFKYGVQAKLIKNKTLTLDNKSSTVIAKDGYGFSLLRPLGNFEIGIALNQIEMTGEEEAVAGYGGGNSWSGVFGLKYKTKNLLMALVYNQSKDHEIDNGTTIFDGQGMEAVIGYDFFKRYNMKVGFNKLQSFNDDLSNDFKKEFYIVGISVKPHKDVKLFLEARSNQSKSNSGQKGNDSAGIGGVLYF